MSDVNANVSAEDVAVPVEETNAKPQLSVVSSAGAMLAAARVEKNWSVRDIAEKLKLSPKQITALENNQFESLPKMVIVRGFVRSYAKLLKIDAEAILHLLPSDRPELPLSENLKPALSTPYIESRLSLVDRQNQNHQYFIGVIILAGLIALFLLHQKFDFVKQVHLLMGQTESGVSQSDASGDNIAKPAVAEQVASFNDKPVVAEHDATTVSVPVVAVADQNVAGSAGNASKEAPKDVSSLTTSQPSASLTEAAVVSSVKPAVTAASNVATNAAVSPAINSATAVGEKSVLQLVFQQDSWIQIKSASGNVVTSHLAKAGTQEFFNVNEVLQVKLGNAPGVKAVLRGVALDLMPDKGTNVANVTVQ